MAQGSHTHKGLLAAMPPAWVRKAEAALLMRAFARAFDVEAPSLRGVSAHKAFELYREFTAACMELALEHEEVARYLRPRLGEEAFALGTLVRRALVLRPNAAFDVARYFYRGIGIRLEEQPDGTLRFGPCSFAVRYTPEDCWFMSAFDEGFLQGILGKSQARLTFGCRLTQGASCCCACLA